eukprot:TRINITY_DN15119_c0_g1_i1.p1 TRINITY_DN15119_c0_g1~~TRINITY_DN15119_c0_g1_i1.p1  ORF type:complete len:667 (-),score=81.20 TRINITY_DN15119_c0_g1_i1:44-2044(-)
MTDNTEYYFAVRTRTQSKPASPAIVLGNEVQGARTLLQLFWKAQQTFDLLHDNMKPSQAMYYYKPPSAGALDQDKDLVDKYSLELSVKLASSVFDEGTYRDNPIVIVVPDAPQAPLSVQRVRPLAASTNISRPPYDIGKNTILADARLVAERDLFALADPSTAAAAAERVESSGFDELFEPKAKGQKKGQKGEDQVQENLAKAYKAICQDSGLHNHDTNWTKERINVCWTDSAQAPGSFSEHVIGAELKTELGGDEKYHTAVYQLWFRASCIAVAQPRVFFCGFVQGRDYIDFFRFKFVRGDNDDLTIETSHTGKQRIRYRDDNNMFLLLVSLLTSSPAQLGLPQCARLPDIHFTDGSVLSDIRLLQQGRHSTVYAASYVISASATSQVVILKQYHQQELRELEALRRLAKEVPELSAHYPKVLLTFSRDQKQWAALTPVGVVLREARIERRRKIPLLVQVAKMLVACWAKGIPHRDISMNNIVIFGDVAVVIDWYTGGTGTSRYVSIRLNNRLFDPGSLKDDLESLFYVALEWLQDARVSTREGSLLHEHKIAMFANEEAFQRALTDVVASAKTFLSEFRAQINNFRDSDFVKWLRTQSKQTAATVIPVVATKSKASSVDADSQRRHKRSYSADPTEDVRDKWARSGSKNLPSSTRLNTHIYFDD